MDQSTGARAVQKYLRQGIERGMKARWFALVIALFCSALLGEEPRKPAYVQTGTLPAPEANQAAAADERFVYAIDSGVVAQYDRATGKRLALSSGEAKHLNSGFLW